MSVVTTRVEGTDGRYLVVNRIDEARCVLSLCFERDGRRRWLGAIELEGAAACDLAEALLQFAAAIVE